MNELHTYIDVENLKQKVKMTYAFDFILCDGDTIRDKYNKLNESLYTLCSTDNNTETAIVLVNEVIAGFIFLCHDDNTWIIKNQKCNDVNYFGDFRRKINENDYQIVFRLYYVENLREDEIIVAVGDKVSMLKLFNYFSSFVNQLPIL